MGRSDARDEKEKNMQTWGRGGQKRARKWAGQKPEMMKRRRTCTTFILQGISPFALYYK
jgi:hypothetical protein